MVTYLTSSAISKMVPVKGLRLSSRTMDAVNGLVDRILHTLILALPPHTIPTSVHLHSTLLSLLPLPTSNHSNSLYRQLQTILSSHLQPLDHDDDLDGLNVTLEEVEGLEDDLDGPPWSFEPCGFRHHRASSVNGVIGRLFPWISTATASMSSRPRSKSLPFLTREVLDDPEYLYSLFQRACSHPSSHHSSSSSSSPSTSSILPQSAVTMVRRMLLCISRYLLSRAADIARSGNRRILNTNILLLALDSDVDLEVLLRISSYTSILLGMVQEETIRTRDSRRPSRAPSITCHLGHLLCPLPSHSHSHYSSHYSSSHHPSSSSSSSSSNLASPIPDKNRTLPPKLAILSGADLDGTTQALPKSTPTSFPFFFSSSSPSPSPSSSSHFPPKSLRSSSKKSEYMSRPLYRSPSEQPLLLSVE
ncbi:MAG: hypothetical protein DHS80DRAFT_21161 [Piptocephalis tieghemiana]|nr:MAG: hypothetical protein DHS80DRAFT_21161 [Piptocephalis tieghemiana]